MAAAFLALAGFAACAQDLPGRAWADAEALFRQDARWLGADGAHSVRLDEDRRYWTFADTFVATSERHVRGESEMVRNTVGIQTGADPLTATMRYFWRRDQHLGPASFFPDQGHAWYWPQASMLLEEGPLVTFLFRVVNTPGQGLGFTTVGYAVALIDDPRAPPDAWEPRIVEATTGTVGAFPATALIREGEYVVAVAIPPGGNLSGSLVRFAAASLASGNLEDPQWWTGTKSGWVQESELGEARPQAVLGHAGSECSIHRDEGAGSYLHITTYGFGAATVGLSTAPDLTGPWSDPVMVYRPPESDGPRPFVYGAVAHPGLAGQAPGDLVVTYATNSLEFSDLFTEHGAAHRYWPRVFLLSIPPGNSSIIRGPGKGSGAGGRGTH